MKILILSDSHRNLSYMQDAVLFEQPDQIIHLGDHMRDADSLIRSFPKIPLLSVKGNCDLDCRGLEQAIVEFRGVRFLAAHGHCYGVKSGLLRYSLAARENQVQVALFGHTHQPFCTQMNSIWFLNPGSCGVSLHPSYGVVELDGQNIQCRISYFDRPHVQ